MSVKIVFTPGFLREFKKLHSALQNEVEQKIAIFTSDPSAPTLRVHKLKGKLKDYWSFSVNYKYRIIFEYDDSKTIALLSVGDHDVYR